MNRNVVPNDVILRKPQVIARTGLSKTTIYLRIRDGSFPAPVSLGPRAIGWYQSEIDQWIGTRTQKIRRAE
jgi:prophage regulatory protein